MPGLPPPADEIFQIQICPSPVLPSRQLTPYPSVACSDSHPAIISGGQRALFPTAASGPGPMQEPPAQVVPSRISRAASSLSGRLPAECFCPGCPFRGTLKSPCHFSASVWATSSPVLTDPGLVPPAHWLPRHCLGSQPIQRGFHCSPEQLFSLLPWPLSWGRTFVCTWLSGGCCLGPSAGPCPGTTVL